MSSNDVTTLPPALSGDRHEIEGRAGRLGYYVSGVGLPLLLFHSINAAASAYETRPIYEHLRSKRRVYAFDLPGFGFSERSDRDYTVGLYVDVILDALDVIREDNGPGAIDALAISLSSEFLARVAAEQPERFRSLAFVTPTGFQSGANELREPGTRRRPGLLSALSFPLWSQPLYSLLVSKRSIRYFLERTFGSKEIDPGLLDYAYLTAHQPGARYAPLAFLSGQLFSTDIRTIYEQLTVPIWMPHATRGDFKDFSEVGWTKSRPSWHVQAFPTGALPHFEATEAFMAAYDNFLEEQADGSASSLRPHRARRSHTDAA